MCRAVQHSCFSRQTDTLTLIITPYTPLLYDSSLRLFGTWLARGLYGFWDPRTSGHPPRQVLGHMSRVPGHTAGKDTLRMATGTFNWTVASRLQSSIAAALHSSLHSQNASKGVGAGVSASNASSAGMPLVASKLLIWLQGSYYTGSA
jgi:hypothetical protein